MRRLALALALALGLGGRALAEPLEPTRREHELAPSEPRVEPLDLNRADEEALLALPGIGPTRARAILAYRASHGGFRSVSQLLQIKGIGRALLKQLRPLVTIGGAPS